MTSRSYGPVHPWYLVGISLLVIAIAATDRQVLSLVVEPMRHDLNVSDFKISLLGGVAFSLFYAACALPIGRLIDAGSRPTILAIGMMLWSLASIGTGLSSTFALVFCMRIAVAVGEATSSPCSIGMITDVFLGKTLGQAINIAMLGAVAGQGIALIGGGFILHQLAGQNLVQLPFGLLLHPWQVVFIAAGAPGLLLAPIVLMSIRDPQRRRVVLNAQGERQCVSFRYLWVFISQNKGAVSAHAFGYAIWSIGEKALAFWGPTYLIRAYHLQVASAGYLFGTLAVLTTVTGNITVGVLVDRATRAGRLDAALRIGRTAAAAGVVPILLFPFMPNLVSSVIALVLGLACTCGYSTVTIAQQQLAPNQVRAQYTAMYLLISNVIGGVVGASAVALVTEHVFHDRAMVGYSLALIAGLSYAIGAVILAAGIKPYGRSMQRIEQQSLPVELFS